MLYIINISKSDEYGMNRDGVFGKQTETRGGFGTAGVCAEFPAKIDFHVYCNRGSDML